MTNVTNTTMTKMKYSDRLRNYEEEKKRLFSIGLNPFEYENMVRALARKWRV